MNLLTADSIRALTTSSPLCLVNGGVKGVREWVEALQPSSAVPSELSREIDLLLFDPGINVLIDPLCGSLFRASLESPINSTVTSCLASAATTLPNTGREFRGASQRRGQKKDGKAHEKVQGSFLKVKEMSADQGRLLSILQRYAESHLHINNPLIKQVPGRTTRITQLMGEVDSSDKKKKVSTSTNQALRTPNLTTGLLRIGEQRIAKKLEQWVKDGDSGNDSQSRSSLLGTGEIIDGGSKKKTGWSFQSLNEKGYGARAGLGISEGTRLSRPRDLDLDVLKRPVRLRNQDMDKEGLSSARDRDPIHEDRLSNLLDAIFPLDIQIQAKSAVEDGQEGHVIRSLERAVEQLSNLEARFFEATEALGKTDKQEEPTIEWLEDDELAGRLQRILRRQARRRGIDFS